MHFAQSPIFEHSVSGVGNLPSHVNRNLSQNRHNHENFTLSVVPAQCLGYTAKKFVN